MNIIVCSLVKYVVDVDESCVLKKAKQLGQTAPAATRNGSHAKVIDDGKMRVISRKMPHRPPWKSLPICQKV